jgi:hypothetical protein
VSLHAQPTSWARVGVSRAIATGWLARVAPPIALTLVVAAAYVPLAGEFLQGSDTFAHIWTSRDVGRVLTAPIMAGTSFPDTWALFYRPVSSLSYTLNYAVSGLNATAFHATDLLIHLLASLGLYGLMRVIGIGGWPAAIGAATFALHPTMASVVPDVPRRHDPLAMALLLGAILLVARPLARPRLALAGSVALLTLAELAKEIAYVGPVLVGPIILLVAWANGLRLRAAVGRAAVTALAWAAVSLVLLGWRLHVLGEIGGYYHHFSPLFDLDVALNDILRNLLWPFRALLQTTLRAWFNEIGLALLVAGLPILLVRRPARAVLLLGWVWLVGFGVFQGLSHSQAPWHTYFTVAGLGFLAGGVFDGLFASRLAGWLPGLPSVRAAARAVLAACLAGAVVFQVASLRESALFTRYSGWHITGELDRLYLASIEPCIRAAPNGSQVLLDNFPYGLDDSSDQFVLVQAGVFAPYALGPAVYLTLGRTDLTFLETGTGATFHALPSGMQTTCSDAGGIWRVETSYQ